MRDYLGYDLRDVLPDVDVDALMEMFIMAVSEAGYPPILEPSDDPRSNNWYVSGVPHEVGMKAAALVAQRLGLSPREVVT